MKYELIIVRYGELGLKAKATRKRFEDALINNIKNALKTKQISHNIKKELGRIYVYTKDIDKSINVLTKIFGITSISPAVKTDIDIKSISRFAIKISKEKITEENSFALRVERTGNHPYSSQDVAVEVGNDIVKKIKSNVNLTNPDFELFIEIRNKNTYFFIEKIPCNGGLPLRTQGNILMLIDSLDSILAAWYIMRRGCKPIFLITKSAVSNVLSDFIEQWYADQDMVMVDSKKKLYKNINKIISERKCDAIVTDHNLHKNPKNVIYDIKRLNENIIVPILHPLIIMQEKEIEKKSKEIGIQK